MRWLEILAAVIVVAALPGCAGEGQRAQPGIASRDYVSWPAVSPRVKADEDGIDPQAAAGFSDGLRWNSNQVEIPTDPAADEVRSWYPERTRLVSTESWNPGFAPGPRLIESLALILDVKGRLPQVSRLVQLKIDFGIPPRRGEFDPGMRDDGEHK